MRPIAFLLAFAAACAAVVVAQGAERFAALKASAAETAKLIESIPVVTFEQTPHEKPRDYGIASEGMFNVSAPRGSFLAERLAKHLAEKYPTMTRQVQISIRYSTQPIVHVNPWRGREDYAINLWIDITKESDAFRLAERVLDLETAGAQRTLKPEQGVVPQ